MLPLLTFASGLIAGAVGVRLLKTAKAPQALKDATHSGVAKAQGTVREATISGLTAIEKTSAHLRAKLTETPAEPPSEAPVEPVPAEEVPTEGNAGSPAAPAGDGAA